MLGFNDRVAAGAPGTGAGAPARVPERDEISEHLKWRLEDIYPDDGAWEQEFEEVKERLKAADRFKGRVGESAEMLLAALKARDEVSQAIDRLAGYAIMRRDEDNSVSRYQAMAQRAITLSAQAESAFAYLTPEILEIPKERVDAFLAENEELAVYRYALSDLFRRKPHFLTPREEQILAETGEIAEGPHTAFSMLNYADMKFGTIVDENGNEVELTHGRYGQFLRSRDRRVRRDAFQTLYKQYLAHKNTLAAVLCTSLKADAFYARMRRHPSALEAALNPENVPLSVYVNLIETVRRRLPSLHRYMKLRKRILGLDELHMYDLYAPLVDGVEFTLSYDEARSLVKEGLRPLGEKYQALLDKAFESRWIDVYENANKTSGAYVRDVYGTHPYVLLNYQGNIDDLFTLAHELGHAMHSALTQESQPYVYSDYAIFVAEVASTVNEALLVNHLLTKEKDPRRRLYILNYYLEQFRTVVYRQTKFAEFEKAVHEQVEAGEAPTAESLGQLYRKLNEEYYGPEVHLDPEIEVEWARVPHFYSAFYVYKYATGFSAANALAQAILEGREGSVERYIEFLSAGGSDDPLNLLLRAGVDMNSPKPIEEALDVFDRLLDETERLAGEVGGIARGL